ncbi:hypothetical protein NRA39_10325 [Acinetobacter baumannii]|nr:hypothetical protein [Acinetobacter baumannii]
MLFSDDEINKLYYLNSLAKSLNTIYMHFKERPGEIFKFERIQVKKEFFFLDLKNNLLYVDDLFFKFNSQDLGNILKLVLDNTVNELNDAYVKFLSGRLRPNKFLNDIVYILYFFFKGLVNKDIFPKDVVVNYQLDERFNEYVKFLEELELTPIGSDLSGDFELRKKFIILEDKVNNLVEQNTLNTNHFESSLNQFLSIQKSIYDEKVLKIIDAYEEKINQIQTEYVVELKGKVANLKDNIESNQVELTNLLGDIKLYKSIVSEKTENEISKHYSSKAEKEKRTYWSATSITASIIIASLGSAWFGLHDYYQNYVSFGPCYADSFYMDDNYKKCVEGLNIIRESTQKFALNYLVMRLIFSVLLFLTVIYTSRIAIRAYSHWRHSESMHLKLASLRPFINQLETKERDQIHKDLVPDYFGKDAGLVDSTNEKFKDLPANVSAVAIKAIEQISGGSSSGKAENNSKKDNEV